MKLAQLVLASGNAGKLREFAGLLADLGTQVIPQSELGIDDADETGLSFVENAILKARHASAASGLPALADDSGLEVDALDGAPGIYSARYSGAEANDRRNIEHLLTQMQSVADGQRRARYQCVLVFMRHADDPTPLICQGSWEGEILREPRGEGGFGYDPVFWLPDQQCSVAELDPAEKQRLSHRGLAAHQLLQALAARYR